MSEDFPTPGDHGTTIEFFGGPFDGAFFDRPSDCPRLVPLPCTRVEQPLDPGTILCIVLFAVYRLGAHDGTLAYIYVGTMTFDDICSLAEEP